MAKNKKAIKSLAVAALATSALVPVASASAATTYSDIVTTVNGQLTSITQDQYNLAVGLGKKPTVEYVKVDNKFYSIGEYNLKVATVGAAQAFEELTKTGKVENITPSVGAVDGSGNITNNAPVPGEFKVESVSAINGTQVEVTFNKAPETAPTKVDFTVEGLEVLSVNAKSGSTTTFVVTTTAQTAGQSYTLKFGEQSKQFTAIQQVATLKADSISYAGQFGKEVTVEYTVLDQAGKPVAGQEVFVRAGADSSNVAQPPITKTVTSDENGKVKFTYTRSDATALDTLVAYVVNSPLVRNSDVTVSWTVANVSGLAIEASKSGTVGHNTILEYTIDAKDQNGVALAKGEKVQVAFDYSDATKSNVTGAPTVQQQLANGTWADVANNGGAVSTAGATVQLLETGKAKIRVVYSVPETADKQIQVTPKFYYSKAGRNLANLTAEDLITVAPSVTLVKQTPVLTLEAVKAGDQIPTNGTKEYKLTAKDQFGNPFRGSVTVDALENADGLSGTKDVTNYQVAFDANEDTVYELTYTNQKQTIDFGFGKQDSDNEDGVAIVSFKFAPGLGETSTSFTPVAFVDADEDGFIGTKEISKQASKITFGQSAPSSIKVTAKSEEVTPTGKIKFDLSVLDAEDKPFKAESDIVFELVEVDDTGKETPVTATGYTVTAGNDPVNSADGKIVAADQVAKAYSVELNVATISEIANKKSYKLYVYADADGNGGRQLDEVVGSASFTVSNALLSKGKLEVIAPAAGSAFQSFVDGSDINSAIDVATTSGDAANITYKYTLQDQAGETVTTTDSATIWTVTNPTKKKMYIYVDGSKVDTLDAGATKSYTSAVGVSSELGLGTEGGTTDSVGKVTVKAQATKVSKTAQTHVTYIAPSTSIVNKTTTTDKTVTYTGVITAFNSDGNQNTDSRTGIDADKKTDANFFVITAGSVGDIVVDTVSLADREPAKINYVIGGNTATEENFEAAVKVGSTVNVKVESGKVTITLN